MKKFLVSFLCSIALVCTGCSFESTPTTGSKTDFDSSTKNLTDKTIESNSVVDSKVLSDDYLDSLSEKIQDVAIKKYPMKESQLFECLFIWNEDDGTLSVHASLAYHGGFTFGQESKIVKDAIDTVFADESISYSSIYIITSFANDSSKYISIHSFGNDEWDYINSTGDSPIVKSNLSISDIVSLDTIELR